MLQILKSKISDVYTLNFKTLCTKKSHCINNFHLTVTPQITSYEERGGGEERGRKGGSGENVQKRNY